MKFTFLKKKGQKGWQVLCVSHEAAMMLLGNKFETECIKFCNNDRILLLCAQTKTLELLNLTMTNQLLFIFIPLPVNLTRLPSS